MDLTNVSTKDLVSELFSRHCVISRTAPTPKHLAHITMDELSAAYILSKDTIKGPCTVIVLDIDIEKLNIKETDKNE